MQLRSIKEADIRAGTRVLLRVDFNVPLKGRKVFSDFRIRESLPVINYILRKGGLVRIITHLGRPAGKKDSSLTLVLVARLLEKILKQKVIFVHDPFKESFCGKYNLSPAIVFFENIRFWAGEEDNNPVFARRLSGWGDIYVNDAFANSHREHASMVGLAKLLPAYAGLGLEKEVVSLEKLLKSPPRPFVAILGGAKVSTKMPLIRRLLKEADKILIGGAMANTILWYQGVSVGSSKAEKGLEGTSVRSFRNKKLFLPKDFLVVGSDHSFNSSVKIRKVGHVGGDEFIVDVGPETVSFFSDLLRRAKTVVWNGPLGFTEFTRFERGTKDLAFFLSDLKSFRVIGGGDTVPLLQKYHLVGKFDHVSTGGGAMLEFLLGKSLPGLRVLKNNHPHEVSRRRSI